MQNAEILRRLSEIEENYMSIYRDYNINAKKIERVETELFSTIEDAQIESMADKIT